MCNPVFFILTARSLVSSQNKRNEWASSTDPVDRTANDRPALLSREGGKGNRETRGRRKGNRGDERGRGDDARNGGDSLSACDGTSIFAPSVPPP